MQAGCDYEMQSWANRHHLNAATITLLVEQGFTSLPLLRNLSPDDITESFQKTQLLPLAQCIALRKALQQLPVGPGGDGGVIAGAVGGGGGGRAGGEAEAIGFEGLAHGASTGYPAMHGAAAHPGHHSAAAKEEFRFLLLGKTGSGKSTTGNTILGAQMFSTGFTFESVTDQCELRNNFHLGRNVQIMDSPGLFDTRRSHEQISIDIVKAVACMHPGPHAILYVIPLGRYTEEEYAVYTRLKALFDDHLTRYLIVCFTGGDRLPPGDTMEAMLRKVPGGLGQVLHECGGRYVLFNNMSSNTAPQVEHLFSLVTEMIRRNGGQPYACPKYKEVGQGLEQEVARRLAEVEERELERTRYVKQLKQQTETAQQAVEQERLQFQKREAEREKVMKQEEEKRERKMQEMMEALKEQRLSLEKQKEEEARIRAEMERERLEQLAVMQEERRREMQEIQEREQKWNEMLIKQREEDRARQEERDQQYMQMMKDMQKQIAEANENKKSGIFGKLMSFASAVAPIVLMAVPMLKGCKK